MFVFTSSIAVYGATPELPVTEATPPKPEDPYGIAKYAVELDLRACHELFGLDYVIFRPHNVFGPRQNIGDRYRNVVGIFMNQILQGRPMTIFGDGTQTRAFSYVDDVAPLIAEAIDLPEARNQVFNIGADEPCSLNDLATLVAAAMDVRAEVTNLAARHEVRHIYADHSEVRRVFGSRAATPLREGLRSHGGVGASARRTRRLALRRHRDREEPAAGMARRMTSYHRAHLVHDPKREAVWKAIARHLAPNVPEGFTRPRARRRLLPLDQQRRGRPPRRRRPVVRAAGTRGAGRRGAGLDIAEGLPSLADESFDVVLASNLLEHFSPDAAANGRRHHRTAAPAGRPADRHSAELPVRVALVFRRLHAPIDLHRRLAPGAAACSRLRYPEGRAPISSRTPCKAPVSR